MITGVKKDTNVKQSTFKNNYEEKMNKKKIINTYLNI